MATRPVGQHGVGFFCIGNTLYDANGNPFRIRGVNDIGYWRGGINYGTNLLPSYQQARVNAARVSFDSFSADGIARDVKVQSFIDRQIVPIPVAFGPFSGGAETTGNEDPANLVAVVDDWLAEGVWLRAKERYIILNVANEWGPETTVYRDTYITQIARLRAANINCTIMVDAGGSGESASDIINFANAIFTADSEHNVIFSIHIYGALWTETAPEVWQWGLNPTLATMGSLGVPVVVGEFSSAEYNTGQGWYPVNPAHVITQAEANGIAWLGWQWYNDSDENMIIDAGGGNNPTVYTGSNAQLTPFGLAMIRDGTQPLALPATVFGQAFAINTNVQAPTAVAHVTVSATGPLVAVTATVPAPTAALAMTETDAVDIAAVVPGPTGALAIDTPAVVTIIATVPAPTAVLAMAPADSMAIDAIVPAPTASLVIYEELVIRATVPVMTSATAIDVEPAPHVTMAIAALVPGPRSHSGGVRGRPWRVIRDLAGEFWIRELRKKHLEETGQVPKTDD